MPAQNRKRRRKYRRKKREKRKIIEKTDLVTSVCNSSSKEAEAGG